MKKKIWKSIVAGFLTATMVVGTAAAASATVPDPDPSTWSFYLNDEKIDVKGVEYGGNNYLKLRDLLKALDINVEYDATKRTVNIDTSTPYVDPADTTPAPAPQVYSDAPMKEVSLSKDAPGYYDELFAVELYNFKNIRSWPTLFEREGWTSYLTASGSITSMDPADLNADRQATLNKIVAARTALVQIKPFQDGINGEVIYLWDEGKEPTTTDKTADTFTFAPSTQDNEDFRPFIIPYLAEDQDNVKGTVIVVSGGGNTSRSNNGEGDKVAPAFQELGYNVFQLQYRVTPYRGSDPAIDLQRAIRVVKNVVAENNLKGGDVIACAGFSAGGINVMSVISSYYGDITPDSVDSNYVCDKIDAINSDMDVAMLIYGAGSFSGGVVELNTKNPKIPHLFIASGEDDATVKPSGAWELWNQAHLNENGQFNSVNPELHIYAENGHGFGPGSPGTSSTTWIATADLYIQKVMDKVEVTFEYEIPEKYVYHQRVYPTRNNQKYMVDVYTTEAHDEYLMKYVLYNTNTVIEGPIVDGVAQVPYNDPSGGYITKLQGQLDIWNEVVPVAWQRVPGR